MPWQHNMPATAGQPYMPYFKHLGLLFGSPFPARPINDLTRLMNELPGIDRKHHEAIVGSAIRSRDRWMGMPAPGGELDVHTDYPILVFPFHDSSVAHVVIRRIGGIDDPDPRFESNPTGAI